MVRHPPSARIEPEQALPLAVRNAPCGWTEMQILRDHIVRAGDRVIECGCHQGLTTVLLAAWTTPTGFIQAFDANVYNAFIARSNMEINGINHAAIYCAAVGGQQGIVNIYHQSNVITRHEKHLQRDSTIMVKLDDIAKPPDVLKLDVEGAELEIVENSTDFIKHVPRLCD